MLASCIHGGNSCHYKIQDQKVNNRTKQKPNFTPEMLVVSKLTKISNIANIYIWKCQKSTNTCTCIIVWGLQRFERITCQSEAEKKYNSNKMYVQYDRWISATVEFSIESFKFVIENIGVSLTIYCDKWITWYDYCSTWTVTNWHSLITYLHKSYV